MNAMVKTSYQIHDFSNLSTFVTISGTVYFQNNLNPQNYALRSAVIEDDTLHMAFDPVDLPESLSCGEHYIEMNPQEGVLVILKTVLNQGDRAHAFYRIIDCAERDHKKYFRVRKYALHADRYKNYDIKYRAGEDGIPEEGFKLIDTQCSFCHDVIRVYERESSNL